MQTNLKSTAALEVPAVILIASADASFRKALATSGIEGHLLRWTKSKAEVLEAVQSLAPDVYFIDETLPDADGFKLCRELKSERIPKYAPVVMIVSDRRPRVFADAFAHGANDVLIKPTTGDIFAVRVRANLKYGGAVRNLNAIQDNLEDRIRLRTHELKSANERLRHEIEERRKLQGQLLEQTAALSNAVEGIARLDSKGVFLHANLAFAKRLGMEPERLTGANWMQTIEKVDQERARQAYCVMRDTGRSELDAVSCVSPLGPLYQRMTLVSLRGPDGGLQGFYCFAKDVTQEVVARSALKEKEKELQQAQKMEAIGRLCGGIAHDFNNYLTAMAGYVELIKASPGVPGTCIEHASKALKSAERAKGLTRQLLTLSRRRVSVPETIDVNEVVRGMEEVLQRTVGENVVVQEKLCEQPCAIMIDRSQLEQVLLNLIVNAREAMPNGGILTIGTGHAEISTGVIASVLPKQDAWVRLWIEDSGCGMNAHTLKRIFEPFFSTKGQERNSGLGLATTYGIVKQHGGHIEVQSELGKGTCFTLHFPEVLAPPKSNAPIDPDISAPGGNETILVVEDNHEVLDVMDGTLRAKGYRILKAKNADEALRVYKENEGKIDLLLTDILMPGMNGIAMSEQLLACNPKLKVIYVSGYSEEQSLLEKLEEGRSLFLQKPWHPEVLFKRIRSLLDYTPVA